MRQKNDSLSLTMLDEAEADLAHLRKKQENLSRASQSPGHQSHGPTVRPLLFLAGKTSRATQYTIGNPLLCLAQTSRFLTHEEQGKPTARKSGGMLIAYCAGGAGEIPVPQWHFRTFNMGHCGDQRDDQETDQRCPVLQRALTAILSSGKG